jgi:hypothetical protein
MGSSFDDRGAADTVSQPAPRRSSRWTASRAATTRGRQGLALALDPAWVALVRWLAGRAQGAALGAIAPVG